MAHAFAALAVPASMIGRALRRPHAEAAITAVTFTSAVAAALFVPTFEMAAGLLWWAPALGLFVAWIWLARTLRFGFVHVGDVVYASLVSLAAFGVARTLATLHSGPMPIRFGAAMLFAALGAAGLELARRAATAAAPQERV